jgi:hypothetical protein
VGVTYYQLGNRLRALESVRKAAELDPKDPLPHVVLGMMHGDAQELRAAIDAAREAQVRMPYLKSLNQLLSNQKGSANVGSALAAQGMEEWAHAYATDAYNPHWAGSALFLADRYPDGFNKNSELYRGFLLDPTVFGASNRFSALVASPGHYGSVGVRAATGDFEQNTLQLAANGLSTSVVPFAYSLVADGGAGQRNPNTLESHGGNFTLGLGLKPLPGLGLFYFGTSTAVDGRFSGHGQPGHADADQRPPGAAHRPPGHRRELPHRAGQHADGEVRRRAPVLAADGDLFSAQQAAALNTTFVGRAGAAALQPGRAAGRLHHRHRPGRLPAAPDDRLQPRPARELGPGEGPGRPRPGVPAQLQQRAGAAVPGRADHHDRAHAGILRRLRLGAGPRPLGLEYQADLVHQHFSANTVMSDRLDLTGVGNLLNTPTLERDSFSELNHRLGLAYAPAPGQKMRVVYQRWRHSAGNGSLGPVDTLGIPVEDRLVESGGLLRRARVQYDWHTGSDSFLQAFADQRQVRNLASATTAQFRVFGVSELDALRARKPVFGEAFDDLEKTPVFLQGRVSSIGMAGNWLLQPQPHAGRPLHAGRQPQQQRGLQRQRGALHSAPLRQPQRLLAGQRQLAGGPERQLPQQPLRRRGQCGGPGSRLGVRHHQFLGKRRQALDHRGRSDQPACEQALGCRAARACGAQRHLPLLIRTLSAAILRP